MVKIKIVIAPNRFQVHGDILSIADARELLDLWLSAIAEVDRLTATARTIDHAADTLGDVSTQLNASGAPAAPHSEESP